VLRPGRVESVVWQAVAPAPRYQEREREREKEREVAAGEKGEKREEIKR
jgi:hypothetical protein